MTIHYPSLAKKSTVAMLAALFLFLPLSTLARVPNDPLYAKQAPFWNQINAPAAWDATIGSPEVVVALIDTGADTKHPDLANNIWTNEFEIPDNGVDDDGNGYIDDRHGWNFIDNTNDVRSLDVASDPDPDAVRHSTIAAGLVGAMFDNNRDGVGLAPLVRIMPLRAIDTRGAGSMPTVANALDYAVQNGANVISMSFVGLNYGEKLYQAIWRAERAGVVVVVAAGNHEPNESGNLNFRPLYPACFDASSSVPLVIGVGSVDIQDQVSRFSNFGACVDIMAPGENIYSTELLAPEFNFHEEFGGPWAGTSYATPIVAGAAALLKSLRPEWNAAEVLRVLQQSADPLLDKNPEYQGLLAAGRLNIGRAVSQTLASQSSAAPIGALYYRLARAIWRYDFNSETPTRVARFPDAAILSVASPGLNKYKDTVVILLKRGLFYYLRLTRADGALLKEFAIDPAESAAWSPRTASWLDDGLGQRLLVTEYSASQKSTRLVAYAITGERQGELFFSGSLAAAEPAGDGLSVFIATRRGQTLIFKRVRWEDGAVLGMVKISGLGRLLDMQVGNFFDPISEQIVFLARSGPAIKQYIVDVDTQSFRSETVGVFSASPVPPEWHLWVRKSGRGRESNIMRYHNQGGTFGVFTARGEPVGTIKLPALTGY